MKGGEWVRILVVTIILGGLGTLFFKVFDLSGRLSNIEGRFQMFVDLQGQVRSLKAEVGIIQSDVNTLRPVAVRILEIPSLGGGSDSRGLIAGRVEGVREPQQYKIVVYSRTNMWYVQPTKEQPLTTINPDGSWKNWIHLGSEYAALLVKPTYRPPPTSEGPPISENEVIAFHTKEARWSP